MYGYMNINNTIPTPQSIPQPTTNKLSDAEWSEVKLLQSKFNNIIYKLGTLQVEKLELDNAINKHKNEESKVCDEWVTIQKLEQELLNRIIAKYGEVNLNIKDGTFSTIQKSASQ